MSTFPCNFISATRQTSTIDRPVPAPYFRKSFILKKGFDNASIVITGLGFYDLFFNGVKITKGHIAPYISNTDDIVYYDEYNVSSLLHEGENVIGVVLGNGIQDCFGGYVWDFDKAIFRSAPKLALSFIAVNGDETFTLFADESFKTAPSPIIFNDLRCGEHYDARLAIDNWNMSSFNDSSWANAINVDSPRGEKQICKAEPIHFFERISPVSITRASNGYIYDFGVNNTGVCELNISAPAGTTVTLVHGELVLDGELYVKNIECKRTISGNTQKVIYTCSGDGNEKYIPSFTYFGFRYVYVTGIDENLATSDLLTYIVLHSDIATVGGFGCSDSTINTLQEMTRRSTISNFNYFLTDCPQREKNGWTADAALSAEQCLLNFDASNSFAVWLDNVRAAMLADGRLPGIVPTTGWGFHFGNGPAWDSVLIYMPYFVYKYSGNKQILADNATSIFRYLNYLTTRMDANGLLKIGLGDWCHAGRELEYEYEAPLIVTDSMISMDIAKKSAEIFDLLDMPLQKQFALSLASNLKNSIREHLLDTKEMTISGNCQTCQAMGIFYDVFTEDEKTIAFSKLVSYVENVDYHLDCGVLGGRIIFHTLSAFGKTDIALKMITNDTFPSYAYWISQGATTLLEDFIRGYHSQNHHFWGDISGWFIKCLGGININPNFNDISRILIAPKFTESIDFVDTYHITKFGKVSVYYKKEDCAVVLDVLIPDEMHGEIVLTDGYTFEDGTTKKLAKSGKYILK